MSSKKIKQLKKKTKQYLATEVKEGSANYWNALCSGNIFGRIGKCFKLLLAIKEKQK